jgi:hypothetical protein
MFEWFEDWTCALGAGATGAAAGAGIYGAIGGVGIAAGGTAVGITLGPFIAIGTVAGLAGYGIYRLGKRAAG